MKRAHNAVVDDLTGEEAQCAGSFGQGPVMELMYTMSTPYGLAVLRVLAYSQRVTTSARKYCYLAS